MSPQEANRHIEVLEARVRALHQSGLELEHSNAALKQEMHRRRRQEEAVSMAAATATGRGGAKSPTKPKVSAASPAKWGVGSPGPKSRGAASPSPKGKVPSPSSSPKSADAVAGGEAAKQLQLLLFDSMEQCSRHVSTAENLRSQLYVVTSERDEALAARSELQLMIKRLRQQIGLMRKQHGELQEELHELRGKALWEAQKRQIRTAKPPPSSQQEHERRRGGAPSAAIPPPLKAPAKTDGAGADGVEMAQLGSRREKMARVYAESSELQRAILSQLAAQRADAADGGWIGAATLALSGTGRRLPERNDGGGGGGGGLASSLVSCNVPTTDSDGGGAEIGSHFGPWLDDGSLPEGTSAGTSLHEGGDDGDDDGDNDAIMGHHEDEEEGGVSYGEEEEEEGYEGYEGDEGEVDIEPGLEANSEFSFFGSHGKPAAPASVNHKYHGEGGDKTVTEDDASASDAAPWSDEEALRVPSEVRRHAEQYAGTGSI